MRCYFMRRGHIEAVEPLLSASDRSAIKEAEELFRRRSGPFSGFEIWDGPRRVHCFPMDDEPAESAGAEEIPVAQ